MNTPSSSPQTRQGCDEYCPRFQRISGWYSARNIGWRVSAQRNNDRLWEIYQPYHPICNRLFFRPRKEPMNLRMLGKNDDQSFNARCEGGISSTMPTHFFIDPFSDDIVFAVNAGRVGLFDMTQSAGTVIDTAPKGGKHRTEYRHVRHHDRVVIFHESSQFFVRLSSMIPFRQI